jgi:Carboxypeptidase regulatory-like domain
MNRGLLVAVLLLVAAAVGGVLLISDPTPPVDPFGVNPPEEGEGKGEEGPRIAEVGGTGNRTAAGNQSSGALEADPNAVIGQVFGPDGRPIDRARVVFAHQQFGGAELGWTLQAILQAGKGADRRGVFRLPVEDGRRSNLAVVAVVPGYVPTRVSGLAAGEQTEIRLHAQLPVPGTVLGPDGTPVAGVPVELFDPQGRTDGLPAVSMTDAEGRFELRSPGPGSYSLRVRSAAGGEYLDDQLEIQDPAEPIQIRLRGNLALQATLRDASGAPVPGAELQLRLSKASRPLVVRANREGVARVYGLPAGRWEVRTEAEGFAPFVEKIDYQGASLITDWTLQAYASLRVHAVNGKGRGLPGAQLRLLADPASALGRGFVLAATTDAEGYAEFAQVIPGRYVLTPESFPGHNPTQLFEQDGATGEADDVAALLLEFGGGQQLEQEFVLRRHGFLNVSVTLAGKPVVGARGSLTRGIATSQEDLAALDLSDLDGLLVFPSVWADEYMVEIQGAPDHLPLRRKLKVGRGGNKRTVELPTGTLLGRVIGPSGPVSDARVLAAGLGGRLKQYFTSDAEGRFELGGFEAGVYQIRVESDGLMAWMDLEFQHTGGAVELGDVELSASHELSGRVENLPTDPGLFGPILTVSDARGKPVRTLPLGGDGEFSVPGLAPGSYLVEVQYDGRRMIEKRVEIPGDGKRLELRLP